MYASKEYQGQGGLQGSLICDRAYSVHIVYHVERVKLITISLAGMLVSFCLTCFKVCLK